MKRAAILIAVTILVFAGCKAKTDKGDRGGMGPATMTDMDAMDPAGDMGGMRPSPAGGDATAEFDKLLAKNKELAKIMEGIKTLDDLKRKKSQYVKINVEILKLNIASLRKAVTLSPDQLKAYVAKSAAMNKTNADFGKKLVEMQKQVMEIKGARDFLAATQKELAEKLRPLTKEMNDLAQRYMKKTAAMNKGPKKDDTKPAPMK